ncbi:MAG: DUF3365 domain-containing protein [Bacteroidales bacterium]|nr:DUF3365 domain-containing protein [Bacteroidales bacterium]
MKNTFQLIAVIVMTVMLTSCSFLGKNRINESDDSTWKWSGTLTQDVAATHKSTGRTVLKASFLTLTGKLSSAMAEGGVQQAMKYCNLQAYPLTDSLSKTYHVSIKRLAAKTRNPANAMGPFEKEIFDTYDRLNAQKESIMDQVVLTKDNYLEYYAPIILTNQCLSCHGNPDSDIKAEDLALINSLYPADMATGFKPGDLRGMWRIRFMPARQK